MIIGREELWETLVGSPVLIGEGNTRVWCGCVTRHTADRKMIGAAEVRFYLEITF
jgi:hypothetical protein